MTWSLDTVLGSAAPAAGGSPTSRKESLFITVCVDKGSVFIFTLIYDANFWCVILNPFLLSSYHYTADPDPQVRFIFFSKMFIIGCPLFPIAAVKPSLTLVEEKVD